MVDEVVQGASVRAFKQLAAYRSGDTFVSWLKGIARNLVLQEYDRRARLAPVAETPTPMPDPQAEDVLILFGSGMRDWSHNTESRLPTILAGRGGGAVKPGQMINARSTLPDLLTSMQTCAGCKLDKPFSRGTHLFPDLG